MNRSREEVKESVGLARSLDSSERDVTSALARLSLIRRMQELDREIHEQCVRDDVRRIFGWKDSSVKAQAWK